MKNLIAYSCIILLVFGCNDSAENQDSESVSSKEIIEIGRKYGFEPSEVTDSNTHTKSFKSKKEVEAIFKKMRKSLDRRAYLNEVSRDTIQPLLKNAETNTEKDSILEKYRQRYPDLFGVDTKDDTSHAKE